MHTFLYNGHYGIFQKRTPFPLEGVPREDTTLLLRTRMGSTFTKIWLLNLGRTDDPRCPNCGSMETIEDALFHGPKYSFHQTKLLGDSSLQDTSPKELIYASGTKSFLENRRKAFLTILKEKNLVQHW